MSDEAVHSNFGHIKGIGWWWGVWQGDRLVGFGAWYRDKRKSFRHEATCLKQARKGQSMPAVPCINHTIVPRTKP